MPKYSLVVLADGVKDGLNLQRLMPTEFLPTQNLFAVDNGNGGRCVRYRSKTRTREIKVKVLKYMLSVTKGVLTLRQ
jgi:hypothetical protein